jgi:hypothetical protein
MMMHQYSKAEQGEWIDKPKEKPLATGDKALMAVGVLLVIVGAAMGVL